MIPVPVILLLLKATIVLVAAWGIARLLARASASVRHLVWLVTLAGLMIIPVVAAWAPLRLEILPAEQRAAVAAPIGEPSLAAPRQDAGRDIVAGAPVQETAPAPAADAAGPLRWRSIVALGPLNLAIITWAIVAFALLAWTAFAWLAVHRIVARSRALDERDWLDLLYEVSDRFALEDAPRLLRSEDAKMPFACGIFRPTIVLPAECDGWSVERRRAVLLHELAHVARRDLAGHTLARIACAVYWFHPLVWTAARQLRAESERACDDMALACGAHAPDYAEHLLDIVTSVRRAHTPIVALAMARPSEFEGRMLAILDPERPRTRPGWRQATLTTATLGLLALVVGAAAPAPKASTPSQSPSFTARRDTSPATVRAANDDVQLDAPLEAKLVVPKVPRAAIDAAVEKSVESSVPVAPGGAMARTVTSVTASVLRSLGLGAEVSATASASIAAALGERDARQGTDDRPALLAKVLRTDSSAAVRRVAAWGLAEHTRNAVATQALAEALRRDANADVREMAAWALGEGGDRADASDEALRAAVRSDADARVRASAAWAIGSIDSHASQATVDALSAALGDASSSVRVAAAWALGSVEPEHAPRALMALLSDRDPRVRRTAAWALYSIEDPDAVSAIQAALRVEPEKELQLAYIRALAVLGEKSVDALKGLIDSPDPKVRDMAVRSLAGGNVAAPWPWPWPQPRPFP